ncbi:MAG: glycerol kinase GlpK [Leptospiraceae bacterium]|nr:glycerol kinase GlpK [Leptospiraceae bacterium]MCB1199809.1 glycerol kinase GlpK [Leptospiraceae bacterium]
MGQPYIITIDQGTTGSRVFLINKNGETIGSSYEEFKQHFPQAGWVEHDANEIWNSVEKLIGKALAAAGANPKDAIGIGITNQRETTVVWDKASGKPIHRAIVWQCRRTSAMCDQLKKDKHEDTFRKKTGLVLDAYFSGTKIRWILNQNKDWQNQAQKGELAFGTIDSWLLYNLSGKEVHATDFTNASRTLLYNIHTREWDKELADILQVPMTMLPKVQNSSSEFGKTKGLKSLPDGIPILSMIGDQQSALFGQLCVEPGSAKNTYGTGCFLVLNLGDKPLQSKHGLVTTLAADREGKPVYALEGSIFIGGAVVQFLRDQMKFLTDSAESEEIARDVGSSEGVVFVPAFAGLGAPWWDQDARGAIFGLTRDTEPAQITRAALKSIALQSYDVINAMQQDAGMKLEFLKVDGGATRNNFLMDFQAGLLGVPVIRPRNVETTVLGAAYLAGLAGGLWTNFDELKDLNPPSATFHPTSMTDEKRDYELNLWRDAIARVRLKP